MIRTLSSIAIFGLLCAGAIAQTTTTPVTRTSNFPMIGLGSSETAQINVTNLAAASSTGTAASCTGSISFFNATGAAIGSATSFTVATGQISSVSLPFAKSGGTGAHTVIRGVVTLTETAGVPCNLESALEVYDSTTGVTHTTLTSGIAGPVPPAAGR